MYRFRSYILSNIHLIMLCSWSHCNQLPLGAFGEDVILTPLCEKKNQHFQRSEGGHVLRISVLQSNCEACLLLSSQGDYLSNLGDM